MNILIELAAAQVCGTLLSLTNVFTYEGVFLPTQVRRIQVVNFLADNLFNEA